MCPQNYDVARVVSRSKTISTFLPKVSCANVCWVDANRTFLTHKNHRTDTFLRNISLLSHAVKPGYGVPKEFPTREKKVDCYVPQTLRNTIVRAFLATKNLCIEIINIPLPYGMHLKVSPKGCHIFKQLRGFKCVEKSIDGTTLACGFLKKEGRRSWYRGETGLWRKKKHTLLTKKIWPLKVCDDVTCLSLGAMT